MLLLLFFYSEASVYKILFYTKLKHLVYERERLPVWLIQALDQSRVADPREAAEKSDFTAFTLTPYAALAEEVELIAMPFQFFLSSIIHTWRLQLMHLFCPVASFGMGAGRAVKHEGEKLNINIEHKCLAIH